MSISPETSPDGVEAAQTTSPVPVRRRERKGSILELQSNTPTMLGDLRHQVFATLAVLPLVLVSCAALFVNSAARDALIDGSESASSNNSSVATFVEVDGDGMDILVGIIATRLWWEALNSLRFYAMVGFDYLRRKPLLVLIEGTSWAVFALVKKSNFGLHPLWVTYVSYWLSTFSIAKMRGRRSWMVYALRATTEVSGLSLMIVTMVGYIYAATVLAVKDPTLEIVATGILYPVLVAVLKTLWLDVMVKHFEKATKQDNAALFEDYTRTCELALSVPSFVSILLINDTTNFATSALLAFLCEIVATFFTMMKYTPQAKRVKNLMKSAANVRTRRILTLKKPISLNGPSNSDETDAAAGAATPIPPEKDDDDKIRERIAIKIANEEWAEKALIVVTPLIALGLSGLGAVPSVVSDLEMAVRMLSLFALEVLVDILKMRICHRFDIRIYDVVVHVDRVGLTTCALVFLLSAWVMSIGMILHKYV